MRLNDIVKGHETNCSSILKSWKRCIVMCCLLAFIAAFSLINIFPPDPKLLQDMKASYDSLWDRKVNWYHQGKTRPDILLVLFGCGDFDITPIMTDPDFPCSVILHRCVSSIQSVDCKDEGIYYLEFFIRLYPIIAKDPKKYTAIIMAHAHEIAWHHTGVYTEDDEAAPALFPNLLRIPLSQRIKQLIALPNYFESNPFGGVFCHYNTRDAVISPSASAGLAHVFWNMIFDGTETFKQRTEVWPPYPYPCCGSFFFQPKNLLLKPLNEYIVIQQHLIDLAHRFRITHHLRGCGRVLESSWQFLLSVPQPAIPPDCKATNVTKAP